MKQNTKEQELSIANYKRLGIDLTVLEDGRLKVAQTRLINGFLLNQNQLIARAKEVFPKHKILPEVYSVDVAAIDIKWVEDKMEEFGIKRKDLIKQLAIDASSLSLFLNGKRKMDKSQRAAFFFYFLTYELNRDLREYI